MGIDFSINDTLQYLYNIDLKNIGILLNKNNTTNNIYKLDHTRDLEGFQGSYYYSAVIQCLGNIGFLKDIFLNRQKLIKENYIKDYTIITNRFYIIMQYMWYRIVILNEQKEKYYALLYEIKSLSGINNIYDKLDSLIEFLLLAMHYEKIINNKEKKNYKLNELKNVFNEKNNSFIKDLFFFEYKMLCNKCKYIIYFKNIILYFNIKELIKNKNITIENLLSFKEEIFCNNCQKIIYSNKILISFPKILIKIIQDIENNNVNFKIAENIKLKNKEKKKIEYELISMIKEFDKDKNNKEIKKVKTFSKSPITNLWYKYEEQYDIKPLTFDIIKNDNIIPNLLIYKKIDNNIK